MSLAERVSIGAGWGVSHSCTLGNLTRVSFAAQAARSLGDLILSATKPERRLTPTPHPQSQNQQTYQLPAPVS